MEEQSTPVEATEDPVTERSRDLRSRLSPALWHANVERALHRLKVIEAVQELCGPGGMSKREALKMVTSGIVHWATYEGWERQVRNRTGPVWERLLDWRLPPEPVRVEEGVRQAVIACRRAVPGIDRKTVRRHLVDQFGPGVRISLRSISRIWQAEGLTQERARSTRSQEIEVYHGGAGFALMSAAALETGLPGKLAHAVITQAQQTANEQDRQFIVPEPEGGRDANGRFTKKYNQDVRQGVEPEEPDRRWDADEDKRKARDLQELSIIGANPEALGAKLLTMGACHMLHGGRSFDGLDGPTGAYMALLTGFAYMPSTLDKCLSSLALGDCETDVWYVYGNVAKKWIGKWTSKEHRWLQCVVYIDATQDPYWTKYYSLSGKVSRTGKVQPCLCRLTVTGGPGIPVLMETYAGTVSLKTELPRLLERVDELIGEGELGRLAVFDAEMATAALLSAFGKRRFVTVIKGNTCREGFKPTGEWRPYRKKDEVREGHVVLHGEGAPPEGLKLRAVEMRRRGSRNPTATIFATNSKTEEMNTRDVVTVYLSRWPHQEHLFRNLRNGLGLDCSHGYGGYCVQHVALEKKLEKAQRKYDKASERAEAAEQAAEQTEQFQEDATDAEVEVADFAAKMSKQETKQADRYLADAEKELTKLESTPRIIYSRDTTRENIVTALTVTVFLLIEFVLREYFGGLDMELRTFIDQFVMNAVTVVTTRTKVLYRIHANPRNPLRTEQLRHACQEVTRRKLRRKGKLLVFEVLDPPDK